MKVLGTCLLSLALLTGCKTATSTTAPQALAPGYSSSTDQTLGETLAALNGFATQESANYQTASADIKAAEKAPLNAFILAVNLANASYVAYHSGTQTQAQAQAAVTNAQSAQTTLIAAQGVK